MLEGKAMIKETDMPENMQNQAMACASEALDLHDVFDCCSIASHIKNLLSLTRSMEVDGNVWWARTSAVSSLVHQGHSCILGLGASIFLSSKEPLLDFNTHA